MAAQKVTYLVAKFIGILFYSMAAILFCGGFWGGFVEGFDKIMFNLSWFNFFFGAAKIIGGLIFIMASIISATFGWMFWGVR